MEYPDTFESTFVRVYRLPAKLTNGYCFGGGIPITFMNVDWFEAQLSGEPEELRAFIAKKQYARQPGKLLVLSDEPKFTFQMTVPQEHSP